MSKLILFFVVVLLITLVLFLSYKMDKNDISKKRKEKIIKNKQKKEDVNSEIYNDIQEMVKASIWEVDEDENIKDQQETMQISTDDIKEKIENDYKENIEDEDLDSYIDILEEYNFNITDSDFEDNQGDENINENIDEELKENKVENKIENKIENKNLNEFTMVFNSKLLKSTEEILEDDEKDDFELEDLEKEIAEANIKKYTRNKKGAPKLESKKETKKNEELVPKRYTRKKDKNIKPENKTVKRYTRKKVINKNTELEEKKNNDIKIEEKPKLKRGRPKKSDTPKRGRPKKVVTKKRGRPKKEEKPKRGRPKKTTDTDKKSKSKE